MEDMDIDQVIDIPDTPDQLAEQTVSDKEVVGKGHVLSAVRHPGNPKCLDEKFLALREDGDGQGTGNDNQRLNSCSRKDLRNFDKSEYLDDSRFHLYGSSSSSMDDDHIFQNTTIDKASRHDKIHSTGPRDMDEGKALCRKLSSLFPRETSEGIVDLTEQKKSEQPRQIGVLCGTSAVLLPKDARDTALDTSGCSSKMSNIYYNSMEKANGYPFEISTLGVDHGKGINISCNPRHEAEKHAYPHRSSLHGVTRCKRLAKNGCISPHNIAKDSQLARQVNNDSKDVEFNKTRGSALNSLPFHVDVRDSVFEDHKITGQNWVNNGSISPYDIADPKQLFEQPSDSSKGVELNETRNTVSNAPPVDITGSVSEGQRMKDKGKGVISQPFTSKEHDAITTGLRRRTQRIPEVETYIASAGSRGVSDGLEGLGGWRSTRNRSKKPQLFDSDETRGHPQWNRNCAANQNRHGSKQSGKALVDSPEVDAMPSRLGTQTPSDSISETNQRNEQRRTVHIKRQRMQGSVPSQPGECSTSVHHDSNIQLLDSAGKSSNRRSMRNQRSHRRGDGDRIIEIEESPSDGRQKASQDISCTDDDVTDARARQVEADEMLARELQEQLYHEMPVHGDGGEIDANIAWALQQDEGAQHASSNASHHDFSLRGSLASRLQRSQFRPPHLRRGRQSRLPASNRMMRLRRHFRSQSPDIAPVHRETAFPLPAWLDVESRMDVLEALEAAATDLSSNIADFQRDFNENDYEMLLALDENNHQHGGASTRQINSLPQSSVQTDDFKEACVICLETPAIGDTIRHLPCLHKFHKDCIDPWLRRRTSCPVCKSSIG